MADSDNIAVSGSSVAAPQGEAPVSTPRNARQQISAVAEQVKSAMAKQGEYRGKPKEAPVIQKQTADNPPPAVASGEVKGDEKALAEVARLSQQNRELTAKLKVHEDAHADYEELKSVRELYKTDPGAALGRLAKADPTGELERLTRIYFAAPEGSAKQADAGDDLATKVESLTQRIEANEKRRLAEEAEAKAAKDKADQEVAAKAVQESAHSYIGGILDGIADSHPRSVAARADAIRMVASVAQGLGRARGLPENESRPEVLEALLKDAFRIVEQELAANPTNNANAESAAPEPGKPHAQNTVVTKKPTIQLTPKKDRMSPKEAKSTASEEIAALLKARL